MRRIRLHSALVLAALAAVALAATLGTGTSTAFDGGPHSGTYTVWSLNETVGFDPHETIADLTNQSGHLPTGPVMITAMENGFLAGGPCGNLYWNPVTNEFVYYGVTGGFQFPIDLDRRAIPSTGAHGSFDGGNVWTNVHGNPSHAPYVQFRQDPVNNPTGGNMRRYDVGAFGATGIRVNQTNGKVYFGNAFPGQLIELDPATNAVRKWSTGNSPYFLELDALGRVYATAFAGGGFPDQIIRLDPTTDDITRWDIPGGGLQGFLSFGTPNHITEDGEGQIWFAESASDEYGRLNPVTNVFEEFSKPGMDNPHGLGTSGAGPTLQLYGEEASGNTTDVLTRAAATPLTTPVAPTSATVAPTTSTASFVDFVAPRSDRIITPTVTTVTSSNGSGIDRFPEPPGVSTPTSSTGVVIPNTILGSVEGTDDVQQFVSKIIVAPPASTEGCKVTYGGRITAANGDKATFGGNAKADGLTGQEEYQDHGPAADINVHSINVLSVVCSSDGTQASIFGTATVNGSGSFDYRIDLKDLGEPGSSDTYRIRLSNGYDSGEQVLKQGNVQIHK